MQRDITIAVAAAAVGFVSEQASSFTATPCGVRGVLAYDVCEPLTKEQYDEWLFDVHYHDLLANPYLKKIVLSTISEERKAKLSSGAEVDGERFFRLAELHFDSYDDYNEYVKWFQQHVVPADRTPAGKSAFKFYLLADVEEIARL